MDNLLAFPAVKREAPPVFDLKGPWTVENGPATGAAYLVRNRDGQIMLAVPRDGLPQDSQTGEPEGAAPALSGEDRARLAACLPGLVQGALLALAPGGTTTPLLKAVASAMPRRLTGETGGAA